MPKLHEVLAVEGTKEGVAKTTAQQAQALFSRGTDRFMAQVKSTKMLGEDAVNPPDEVTESSFTVTQVVKELISKMGSYWDVIQQKEGTNQVAKADLRIGDKVLLTDVPATFLLGMEKRLKAFKEVIVEAPVLPVGIAFELDKDKGLGVYKAVHIERRNKTEKTIVPIILSPATKEHPAQVEKLVKDVTVGHIDLQEWSTMWPQKTKQQVIDRLDDLIQACLLARQAANNVDVVKAAKFSTAFTAYLLEGVE